MVYVTAVTLDAWLAIKASYSDAASAVFVALAVDIAGSFGGSTNLSNTSPMDDFLKPPLHLPNLGYDNKRQDTAAVAEDVVAHRTVAKRLVEDLHRSRFDVGLWHRTMEHLDSITRGSTINEVHLPHCYFRFNSLIYNF